MKKVDNRVSPTSISSVLDFQKLPIKDESEEEQDEIMTFRTASGHKIVALPSPKSVVERVVLLESLSDDFRGPPTPRRKDDDSDNDDDDDATDVESELADVAPMPTIETTTSLEHRPCDPVAKFLLSKC